MRLSGHLIADNYKVIPAETTITYGDDVDSIAITSFGTMFQLIEKRVLRETFNRALIDYWYRPLGRTEIDMLADWYIRRGWRFLPWLVVWKVTNLWERTFYRMAVPAVPWSIRKIGDRITVRMVLRGYLRRVLLRPRYDYPD